MRPSSARLAALLLLVGLGVPAGCGYSVVRYGQGIGGAETLAIEPLSNETFESGVEMVVLEALRREALARGGLRLVEDPERADLVLSGSVRRLSVQPRSFSSVVLALEYEVGMALQLQAERRGGRTLPIDPRALAETDTYLASADLEAMRKNRRETIHRLASLLSARVFDSLYETAAGAAPEPAGATPP